MALRKLLYELVYEQEAILFIEVNLDALKEILKYKVYVARGKKLGWAMGSPFLACAPHLDACRVDTVFIVRQQQTTQPSNSELSFPSSRSQPAPNERWLGFTSIGSLASLLKSLHFVSSLTSPPPPPLALGPVAHPHCHIHG
jgi:hypothetical protein